MMTLNLLFDFLPGFLLFGRSHYSPCSCLTSCFGGAACRVRGSLESDCCPGMATTRRRRTYQPRQPRCAQIHYSSQAVKGLSGRLMTCYVILISDLRGGSCGQCTSPSAYFYLPTSPATSSLSCAAPSQSSSRAFLVAS